MQLTLVAIGSKFQKHSLPIIVLHVQLLDFVLVPPDLMELFAYTLLLLQHHQHQLILHPQPVLLLELYYLHLVVLLIHMQLHCMHKQYLVDQVILLGLIAEVL